MAEKTMNIGSATNNSLVNVNVNGTISSSGSIRSDNGLDVYGMTVLNNDTYMYPETLDTAILDNPTFGVLLVNGTGGQVVNAADQMYFDYSTQVFYFNCPVACASGEFNGDLVGNANTASQLNNALKVGDKSFNGSATVTISAADLGLSNAMHFRGTTTVTNPTGTYTNGDVVLNTTTKKEYVYNNGSWVELGDESSYVLKESGKGLSTNDYTTEEKTKLAGLSNYSLPTASSSTLGGIKVGSTLTINSGVLNYNLPVATSSALGGVKAGNNVSIASDGTLSIGGYLPLSGGTITGDITSTTGKGLKVSGTGTVTGVTVTSNSNGVAIRALDDGTTGLWDTDASQWIIFSSNGNASTQMPLYGAVWNDYAEFRRCYDGEAGQCVVENGDDTMSVSTKRLQYGGIISDTFGFVIGDKDNGKPIAVSGRVLAYTDKDRKTFKPGDAVCSGPNGTVSKMTRKEIKDYPEKILGIVSAVPTYDFWGPKQIPVNGRVWIKVR